MKNKRDKSKQLEQFLLKDKQDNLSFWTEEELKKISLEDSISMGLFSKLFLRFSILNESKNGEQFVDDEPLLPLLSAGLSKLFSLHPGLEDLVYLKEKTLKLNIQSN